MDRRQLLALLALGTASACTRAVDAAGSAPGPLPQPAPAPGQPVALPVLRPTSSPTPEATALDPTYPPASFPPETAGGPPLLISRLPEQARLADYIALTIDDGFNAETVAAYVEFATTTGIHLTFNPNGVYAHVWEPHADALRPLVEAGQVQIGNHTYRHQDLRRLSDHGIEEELQKNEDWVQATFGTSTRPWFRPPYGFRSERTDEVAASLGWQNVLLWNGSFGDAGTLPRTVLLREARTWLNAGTILLGHANHPTVTHLYPQIVEILTERGLTPVTLREAFSLATPEETGTPSPPVPPAG
ncbi:MAG: polysaccharide deacetylase [Frankiales bacterium]|nr:polysaccharide deacetylase [Frankiales bacterium]